MCHPMPKFVLFIGFSVVLLMGCSKDDLGARNPNLVAVNFAVTFNTNLPQYSTLQFPGNAIYEPNAGLRGVFVINTGTGIRAWEAADPNHPPSNCSTMQLNGVEATCDCEGNIYNLYTGLAKGQKLPYPLLEYRASVSGNVITVSN